MSSGEMIERNNEIATAGHAAAATAEIQAALAVAYKQGRDEDACRRRMLEACKRPFFQAIALYAYPRGGTTVSGPSINMAREFARHWGHIRYGSHVVQDDDEAMCVRGWAWDLVTNQKVEQDARFGKKIYRKNGGWIRPDERELRELVNKHGSICVRNCLLQLIPSDMLDEAKEAIRAATVGDAKKNKKGTTDKLVSAFLEVGVKSSDLEQYLKCRIDAATPEQLADLRAVYTSLRDKHSTWTDYVPRPKVRAAFMPQADAAVEAESVADMAAGRSKTTPELVASIRDDTRSMVACIDCGHLTPPDMVDDGRCPECFSAAERPV